MIDLHTHSTCSDGLSTPSQLMREASEAGIEVLGLTDHDTVEGWDEAANCVAFTGVSLVRAMEMTAKVHEVPVHILAYLFDPYNPRITAHCSRMFHEREIRARQMVERIGRDVPLRWEDVRVEQGQPVGRPHIADALVSIGVVKDRDEAFVRFLGPNSSYYVPHIMPEAAEVIAWVREAGGKTVLAHPDACGRGSVVSKYAIYELAEEGLFGLEVDHRDNARPERLEKLARECGLVRMGSSDYHGAGKPNRLGENTTMPEVLASLASNSFLEVLVP